PPPEFHGETPAHFHARREVRLEGRNRETNEPDERDLAANLDGPQPEAVLLEMRLDSSDHHIALFMGQHTREVFHDLRVGVEPGKREAIGLDPAPQQKTICLNLARKVHENAGSEHTTLACRTEFEISAEAVALAAAGLATHSATAMGAESALR